MRWLLFFPILQQVVLSSAQSDSTRLWNKCLHLVFIIILSYLILTTLFEIQAVKTHLTCMGTSMNNCRSYCLHSVFIIGAIWLSQNRSYFSVPLNICPMKYCCINVETICHLKCFELLLYAAMLKTNEQTNQLFPFWNTFQAVMNTKQIVIIFYIDKSSSNNTISQWNVISIWRIRKSSLHSKSVLFGNHLLHHVKN